MIAVDNILRRNALLAGTDGDGYTMLVAATDEDYILPFQSEVSHIYVRRYVHSGQMPYVHTAVGVGQSRRHGGTLVMVFFHDSLVVY